MSKEPGPVIILPHHHTNAEAFEVRERTTGQSYVFRYDPYEQIIECIIASDDPNGRFGSIVNTIQEQNGCRCRSMYEHFVGMYAQALTDAAELQFVQWVNANDGSPLPTSREIFQMSELNGWESQWEL